MKIYCIYTLSDANGVVRYVGSTCNPDLRLIGHRSEKKKSAKTAWIKSLGYEPVMDLLEDDIEDKREARILERYWVEQMKSWGFNLLNMVSPIAEKGRLEIRATDVDPKLFQAIKEGAEKNVRSMSGEIIFHLKKAYNL